MTEAENHHVAEIGVIGDSGFYELLRNAEEVTVETPYGAPSDAISTGDVGCRSPTRTADTGARPC
ncbi:hypothetical protein [Streptomyces sp. NPDC019937]|uniref:hypothetical protein n=1 Tax=Streptomyces sp. NPDC019937 TaxID=3154787 RepID=UPI0033BFE0C3